MGQKPRVRVPLLPDFIGRDSYVDSVAVRVRRSWTSAEFEEFRRHCGRFYRDAVKLPEPLGNRYMLVDFFHQPQPRIFELIEEHGLQLFQLHVALDLTTSTFDEAIEGQRFIEHRIQRSSRPVNLSSWEGETTAYIGRTQSLAGAQIVVYSDHRSKVGRFPCVHVEYRIRGVQALEREKFGCPSDVVALNHQEFWAQRLQLRTPPTFDKLVRHRVRHLARNQRRPNVDTIQRTVRLQLRAASGPELNTVLSSDLLHLLQSWNYVGANPGRLFSRESNKWLLPQPDNALWNGTHCPRGKSQNRKQKAIRRTVPVLLESAPAEDVLLEQLLHVRCGANSTCPVCGTIGSSFYRVHGRRAYVCRHCQSHIYPCSGTPLARIRSELGRWFEAAKLFEMHPEVRVSDLRRQLNISDKLARRQFKILRANRFVSQMVACLNRALALRGKYEGS